MIDINYKPNNMKGSKDLSIVLSDIHFPFHNEPILNSVTDFVIDLKPKELVLNGDILDMFEASTFDKHPNIEASMKLEIDLALKWFEKLRKNLPKTKIIFIYGNHEYRWERYFIRQAPTLIGLPGFSLAEQLKLDDFGIRLIDSGLNQNVYDTGRELLIGHFDKVSKHSAYTAKNLLDEKGVSLIQGHIHRIGQHLRTTPYGIRHAVEGGCLCDVNPSYVLNPNWQNGFTVVNWVDSKPLIETILIQDGKFVYGGKIYSA